MSTKPEVFIVAACRTPIGSFQGQFEKISASKLGGIAIEEAIKRAEFLEHKDVDQVIMGQVLTAGQGQNPARQAAVFANLPFSIPANTVNMLCGSGLKAVSYAYQAIRNEDCNIVVAGGQENMTRAHHSAYIRSAKLGGISFSDTLISDGLTDAFENVHMGETAEHLAKTYSISRENQDLYALKSQQKTGEAIRSGYFDSEIVAVPGNKSSACKNDEYPRLDTTLESLSKLRTVFAKNGTVTAGNASGINDGAAALVFCSSEKVKDRKLKPLARIVALAEVGIEPLNMGLGPIQAVKEVLAKAKWAIEEVDLFELNEAFAVQSIIVESQLELDKTKVNVSGGALALGHPIGASGARILVTLIYNLRRLHKKKGVAALCVGGGMGIAIAIEACSD